MATGIGYLLKYLLAKKEIDLTADTVNLVLMQPGFVWNPATHKTYSDISANELTTANGYTAGGQALTGATVTEDDVDGYTKASWNNASWVVTDSDLLACGAFLVDTSVVSPASPILGYIDFGSTITTYVGGTLLVSNIAIYLN